MDRSSLRRLRTGEDTLELDPSRIHSRISKTKSTLSSRRSRVKSKSNRKNRARSPSNLRKQVRTLSILMYPSRRKGRAGEEEGEEEERQSREEPGEERRNQVEQRELDRLLRKDHDPCRHREGATVHSRSCLLQTERHYKRRSRNRKSTEGRRLLRTRRTTKGPTLRKPRV